MKRIGLMLGILACSVTGASAARADDGYVVYDSVDCGCEEPIFVASYPAPAVPAVYGGPAAMRWRYRPLLGGTVTRIRYVNYGYIPSYYAPFWW